MKKNSIKMEYPIYGILFGLLVCVIWINILFVLSTRENLYDFGSFVASGLLANAGKDPYSDQSPLIFSVKFSEHGPEGVAPNLNPPISVLIFKSIANIEPAISLTIWRISTIGLFLVALVLLQRTYPLSGIQSILRFVWAIGLAGFWHTIQLGQLYSLLLLLTVIAWILLKQRKRILAGILLGILIALKPNFIFWAILLLVAGNWRTFLAAGFTAASISVLPLITYGVEIYRQWLDASSIFTTPLLLFPGNNSFQGLAARFGNTNIGIIASALLAIIAIIYVIRVKPDREKVNALGIISSLLISPIAWTGYTILTLPIFFEQKKWNWAFFISASIFTVPFAIPLNLFTKNLADFIIFGWFYGWGLLLLLSGTLFPSNRRTERAEAITSNIHTN